MIYRTDRDLEILAVASNDELNTLIDYLIRDEHGKLRSDEKLTATAGYKKCPNCPRVYWKDIAAEMQRIGADKLATFVRFGRGVLYKEIICDVCDKMELNCSKSSDASDIEKCLVEKILLDLVSQMDKDKLKELAYGLEIKIDDLNKQAISDAIIAMTVDDECYYKMTLLVAGYVAESRQTRKRYHHWDSLDICYAPIIRLVLKAAEITKPVYNTIIPVVVQIAYIRAKYSRKLHAEATVVVRNKTGIHRRCASIITQTALRYASDIQLCAKGKRVDVKSVLMVMSMGLIKGTEIKFIAEGGDAPEAVKSLVDLINSKFGEDYC